MTIRATHLWAYFGEWSERAIAWELLALVREGVDLRILSFRNALHSADEDPALGHSVSFLDPFPDLCGKAVAAWGLMASLPSALVGPHALMFRHPLLPGHGLVDGALRVRSAARRVALERRLAAERPDILHAQHAHVGWWAMPTARRLGIPLAVSVRGIDLLLLERLAAGRWGEFADMPCLLLARSEEMAERLRALGLPAGRVVVHPSGIPAEGIAFRKRLPPEGRSPVVFSAGRLVPKKGMDDAIRALAALQRTARRPFVLRIAGDGPLWKDLEELARRLGVADRVSFLGHLPHGKVMEEMGRADVFLLASRTAEDGDREGIPNAVKEAAASGLPVVSTSHAGISEAVIHGETGLLAPEGDVDALADALDAMLSRPERWADMGGKGRALVAEKYDIRSLARKLVLHYRELQISAAPHSLREKGRGEEEPLSPQERGRGEGQTAQGASRSAKSPPTNAKHDSQLAPSTAPTPAPFPKGRGGSGAAKGQAGCPSCIQPRLSVIMPVYNEAGTVCEALERVLAVDVDMEVVVVDDGSDDGTSERLASVGDPRVRILREPANRGKGWAVRRGIAMSRGRAAIIQDADLEYNPRDFLPLLDAMEKEGASVVYGNRLHPGNQRCSHRRYLWGGMLVTTVANMLYGAGIHDEPVCYKLFEGDLLRSLNLRSEGFEFCPEVTAIVRRLGCRIAERPIRYEPRTIREGKKIRWTDGVRALWTLLKYRFEPRGGLTKADAAWSKPVAGKGGLPAPKTGVRSVPARA